MHLDLINGMNAALFIAKSFRQSDVDPLMGLQAASQYIESGEKLAKSIRAINSYFIYLGINEKIF